MELLEVTPMLGPVTTTAPVVLPGGELYPSTSNVCYLSGLPTGIKSLLVVARFLRSFRSFLK